MEIFVALWIIDQCLSKIILNFEMVVNLISVTSCTIFYKINSSRIMFCVIERMSSDFQPLDYADGRTVLTPNGSLVIQSVVPNDEGYYLCRATNGIGTGLSKVVSLAVNGKYNISLHYYHAFIVQLIQQFLQHPHIHPHYW
jgi:hypothetical protein